MFRRLIAASCAVAALGWAASARADDACAIHLTPQSPGLAWSAAAADAQHAIDATAPGARDCRRIDLEIAGDSAMLTFVTLDGRTAVRAVESPGHLRAVVEGLLVTMPPSAPPVEATPLAPTAPIVSDVPASPIAPSKAAPDVASHVILSANAGARFGFAKAFAGPALGVDASFTLARWEIGVLGVWEPATYDISSRAPGGFRMSALGAGVHAGRREPIGNVQIFYALDLLLMTNDSTADASTGRSTNNPRIGVMGGVVWPRNAKIRFRPQLQLDFNPSRHQSGLESQALSPLPRWGLGLAFGMETEVL